jgi:hypothetical protein
MCSAIYSGQVFIKLEISPHIFGRKLKTSGFKVCKSVHHHTIQINQPLDAAISPVYYLTFIYSSTCFGHPHAHHQELQQLQ